MVAVVQFFKAEGLALVAAIGLAFTLFTGLDSFLEFCEWIRPIVFYWRYYLYKIFDLILFWLPFSLPNSVKEVFALGILVLFLVMRIGIQYDSFSNSSESEPWFSMQGLAKFYYRSVYVSTGIVLVVFLFPIIGWKPPADSTRQSGFLAKYDAFTAFLPMFMKGAAATALIGILYFSGDKIETRVQVALFSKHMWRVVTIIAAIIVINYIGLYADEIRGWKEKPVIPDVHINI